MSRLLGSNRLAESASRRGLTADPRASANALGTLWLATMRNVPEFMQMKTTESGLAESHGIRQHGLEHRRELARRA